MGLIKLFIVLESGYRDMVFVIFWCCLGSLKYVYDTRIRNFTR